MSEAVRIEDERDGDAAAISTLVSRAFEGHPHSAGTEAAIVERLRAADALTISLIALDGTGEVVGHVAFSPVMADGFACGWHALGPLAVEPESQRSGIGSALVQQGLDRLHRLGSRGCLLVGDSAYYGRFGFQPARNLLIGEPLQAHLQVLALNGREPEGRLAFHPAFG